jgi:hypothetical protein
MEEVDPWEKVVNLESTWYNEGYIEGLENSKCSDEYEEGVRAGIMKCYTIGLELGYMKGAIERTADENVSNRILTRRREVIDRILAVPMTNDENFDFEQEIRDLRSLFNQCAVDIPPFLEMYSNINQSPSSSNNRVSRGKTTKGLDW